MGVVSMNGKSYNIPEGANISMISSGRHTTIYVNGKIFNPEASEKRKTVKPVFEGDGFRLREDLTMESEDGLTLYRIEATRQRMKGRVQSGMVGGFVTTAENIIGDAWVDKTSKVVSPDVSIRGSVAVLENSVLDGDVLLFGDAEVRSSTITGGRIGDQALVQGSTLSGDVEVLEAARVINSVVFGQSVIRGNTVVDHSSVRGMVTLDASARLESSSVPGTLDANGRSAVKNSKISGVATLTHNAVMDGSKVSGVANLSGSSVMDGSKVSGVATLSGEGLMSDSKVIGVATVSGKGRVVDKKIQDFLTVSS